jgi:hypothetical protein
MVDLMMPHWKRWGAVTLITPVDDPIAGSLTVGRSEHHGRSTIARMMRAVSILQQHGGGAILEWDSVILAETTGGDNQCSGLFKNVEPRFKGSQYPHAPWLLNSAALARAAEVGRDLYELGFPDRWLGAMNLSWVPDGYSQNALDTPQKMEQCLQAVMRGGRLVHGFKNPAQIRAILAARPAHEQATGSSERGS